MGWAVYGIHHRAFDLGLVGLVSFVPSLPRVTYGDRLTPALSQPNIDAAAKYGVLSAAFPAGDIISGLVN